MNIIIGLIAGIFGGLVGLGDGVVIIPLMVGMMKQGQHEAHGTSLVALVFTGTTTYSLRGFRIDIHDIHSDAETSQIQITRLTSEFT